MRDNFASCTLYLLIDDMAQSKSKRKKPAQSGRKKGVTNKITANMREAIKAFSQNNFDKFQKSYNKLDAQSQCKIYVDLLAYSVPKMSSIDINGEVSTSGSISAELRQMANETIEHIEHIEQENSREK